MKIYNPALGNSLLAVNKSIFIMTTDSIIIMISTFDLIIIYNLTESCSGKSA